MRGLLAGPPDKAVVIQTSLTLNDRFGSKAVIGPSTPASSLLQKKAGYTTPTMQAVIHQATI